MSASAPPADAITISQTLGLLDGPFVETATAVADDAYAVWLGSGISLSRVPGLKIVILRVLSHLQGRCNAADGSCTYQKSLRAILALAPLTADEWARLDLSRLPADWVDINVILDRLVTNYARMLDQAPDNEPPDYLVWTGIDVVAQYADPTIEPSAEHLALAALILEGVTSDIASANWDGLVEKAVERLGGAADPSPLQVRIRAEDTRGLVSRARLYKFHGCAVRAGQDEAVYREYLVGRKSQIDRWQHDDLFKIVNGKLIDLSRSKPTLMLGLSVQDTNIQGIFAAAQNQMAWIFPNHPPAYVFSEEALGVDQRGLLQNVYPADYVANQVAIKDSALLRAYASSLLPALWLHVMETKLVALAGLAAPYLNLAETTALGSGLRLLRDAAAATAVHGAHTDFMETALTLSGRGLALLRTGQTNGAGLYSPLTSTPRPVLLGDPNLVSSGLCGFALGLGLLGYGQAAGLWTCSVSSAPIVGDGVLKITSPARTAELFFTASPQAAAQLFIQGHVSHDEDAILVHSHVSPPVATRSPSAAPGRIGKLGLREVSIATLLEGQPQLDSLLGDLKAEMCL